MQAVTSWFASIGFRPPLLLDGKIHRVERLGRKGKAAWYIGWQEPFITAIAGDWRTGEKWEFKDSAKTLTPSEQRAVKAKIKKAMMEAEIEREREREMVALRADITLRSAAPFGSHPYLQKKQVKAFGCYFLDDEMLIPVRDLAGKTWGYERILENGKKLFLPGQRVDGCCHKIEGGKDRVFVAEGYATAASIHMATGDTVLCAYHAGNLREIARQARIHFPMADLVIAGDDDRWSQGNPGRTKAEEAAQVAECAIVFPHFESLASEPTDFNDLHATEGLSVVKRQLETAYEQENKELTAFHLRSGTIPPKVRLALTNFVEESARKDTWRYVAKQLAWLGKKEEDIISLITRSKTYPGQVGKDQAGEIKSAVVKGILNAERTRH